MGLSLFIKDMNIIAPLDTLPNDRGGFSPDMLKGKFDEGGIALKNYINLILIPEIESAIEAASQGVSPGSGIDGMIIVDASIHTRKLAAGAVTSDKIADGGIATENIADEAVTTAKIAPKSIGRAQLEDEAIMLQSADFPNKVVPERALADGAAATAKIADGAVTTAKLADGAITTAKIAAAARTQYFSVELTAEGWTGDAAPFTQTATVSGMLTSDKPKVYFSAPDDAASAEDWLEAFALLYKVTSAANSVTLSAYEKPETTITVALEVIRI